MIYIGYGYNSVANVPIKFFYPNNFSQNFSKKQTFSPSINMHYTSTSSASHLDQWDCRTLGKHPMGSLRLSHVTSAVSAGKQGRWVLV